MNLVTLKRLAIGYGLLLTLAAGGLAFANLFGFAATAIQFGGDHAPDTGAARMWMHLGWVFGVCMAATGAAIKIRKEGSKPHTIETPQKEQSQEIAPTQNKDPDEPSATGTRHGLIVSAMWGGGFGTILGAALGVTFVLLWFSIAYSPFAPQDWVSSISVERQPVSTSVREEPFAVSGHPVVLFAFALPVAVGALCGAVFGGIVRASDVA